MSNYGYEKVSNGAGKGDKPRNCYSKQFKSNFDDIKWVTKPKSPKVSTDSKRK